MIRKILGISFILLFLTAAILMTVGLQLWARVLGVLSLVLFLFSIWKFFKNKGLSTVLVCALLIVYVWAAYWLYPAGIINDAAILLLTLLVVALSLWEKYNQSRWRSRKE